MARPTESCRSATEGRCSRRRESRRKRSGSAAAGTRTWRSSASAGSSSISSPGGCPPPSGERLEGDHREGVPDAGQPLDAFGDEVADIALVVQVALQYQVVLSRDGIYFRDGFDSLDEFARDLVGLPQVAFHLNEDGLHRARSPNGRRLTPSF